MAPVTGTRNNGEDDSNASIHGLTGGGFVVVWQNTDADDTDIKFQVYTAAAVAVGGVGVVDDGGATDVNIDPTVVALNDGGFAIIFDDNEANVLKVSRFDATGAAVGSVVTISGGAADPQATALEEGRFAVTWVAGDDIKVEIFDIRDAPNTGVYTPLEWQVGTVGDDVFTADAGTAGAEVHGGDGNDIITANGDDKAYFGDGGDDRIIVASLIGGDSFNGGAGADLIDWSGIAETGAEFDLEAGTANSAGFAEAEVMVGFENLIGTDNADTIIGDANANVLTGGGGNDIINGGDGDDRLTGGAGLDALAGGDGDDFYDLTAAGDENDIVTELAGGGVDTIQAAFNVTLAANFENLILTNAAGPNIGDGNSEANRIEGGAAIDTLRGRDGDDILIGNDGADILIGDAGGDDLRGGAGNDRLSGGAGADTMTGGDGNDIYTVDDVGDTVIEQPGGGTQDRINVFVDFVNPLDVEFFVGSFSTVGLTLTGNAQSNRISGANRINSPDTILGEDGNDRLVGLVGNDTINGGDGRDRIFGNSGNDIIDGGAGNDVVTGQFGADIFIVGLAGGRDVITDFTSAEDQIDLSAHGFADLAAVQAATTDVSGSAVIALGGGDQVQLLGVLEAQLQAGDFILV